MIAGMERYLDRLRSEAVASRSPSADKLRAMLGATDARIQIRSLENLGKIGGTGAFTVDAVRWPVLEGVTAEGIHLVPAQARRGCVVAIPAVDQPPEDLLPARQFAAAGYEVLAPVLIDTGTGFSGNPKVRMSGLPHREWIYREFSAINRLIVAEEDGPVERRYSFPVGILLGR